jgi:hypothetical protein
MYARLLSRYDPLTPRPLELSCPHQFRKIHQIWQDLRRQEQSKIDDWRGIGGHRSVVLQPYSAHGGVGECGHGNGDAYPRP